MRVLVIPPGKPLGQRCKPWVAWVWNSHCLYKKKKGSKRGWRRKEEKVKGRRGEAKEGNRQEGQKGETENLV